MQLSPPKKYFQRASACFSTQLQPSQQNDIALERGGIEIMSHARQNPAQVKTRQNFSSPLNFDNWYNNPNMPKQTKKSPEIDYSELAIVLNELDRAHGLQDLSPDPLEVVHEYTDPADRETTALIASCLAYGNVRQIVKSVRNALNRLGDHPAKTLPPIRPEKALRLARGFKHRLHAEGDLARLFLTTGRLLKKYGSLQNAFLSAAPENAELKERLDAFVNLLHERAESKHIDRHSPDASYFDHLLPRPSRGSACKRLNLFLLWVARPDDGIALGLWHSPKPHELIMPLDTHVWRIGKYLGLIKRGTADWKAARELTDHLKQIDPDDPTRFDFAISRLGIQRLCRSEKPGTHCVKCALRGLCVRD